MSKISVIVPVYNTRTDYLIKCIESILGQDHQDLELILVNDGSSNDAPTVCAMAAAKDSRVLYIPIKNSGVSAARNAGLERAGGDFILFVDSDDFLSPSLFSALLDAAGKDVDILFFGYCTSYVNRELKRVLKDPPLSLFTPDTLQLAILNANPRLGPLEVGAPWGKLIRRSTLERGGVRFIPRLKKGQDTVFTLYLLEECKKLSYLPVEGYHYRVSSSSISHRYSPDMIAIMEKTLDAYSTFVKKYHEGDERYASALLNKYYRVMTGEYLDLYFIHPDNPSDAASLRAEYLSLMEKEPYDRAIASLSEETLTGLDRLIYDLIRKKKTRTLWTLHRILRTAKNVIVRGYG